MTDEASQQTFHAHHSFLILLRQEGLRRRRAWCVLHRCRVVLAWRAFHVWPANACLRIAPSSSRAIWRTFPSVLGELDPVLAPSPGGPGTVRAAAAAGVSWCSKCVPHAFSNGGVDPPSDPRTRMGGSPRPQPVTPRPTPCGSFFSAGGGGIQWQSRLALDHPEEGVPSPFDTQEEPMEPKVRFRTISRRKARRGRGYHHGGGLVVASQTHKSVVSEPTVPILRIMLSANPAPSWSPKVFAVLHRTGVPVQLGPPVTSIHPFLQPSDEIRSKK